MAFVAYWPLKDDALFSADLGKVVLDNRLYYGTGGAMLFVAFTCFLFAIVRELLAVSRVRRDLRKSLESGRHGLEST